MINASQYYTNHFSFMNINASAIAAANSQRYTHTHTDSRNRIDLHSVHGARYDARDSTERFNDDVKESICKNELHAFLLPAVCKM